MDSLEARIVRICRVMFEKRITFTDLDSSPKKLTFLHLAAALGSSALIHLLRPCSELCEHAEAGTERGDVTPLWDPHSKDVFGCTPLMWACWRGHEKAALKLLAWRPSTYVDHDNSGRSPKDMAAETKHLDLVGKMEVFLRRHDNR